MKKQFNKPNFLIIDVQNEIITTSGSEGEVNVSGDNANSDGSPEDPNFAPMRFRN